MHSLKWAILSERANERKSQERMSKRANSQPCLGHPDAHLTQPTDADDADPLAALVGLPGVEGGEHGDAGTEDGTGHLQRIVIRDLTKTISLSKK